MAKGDSETFTEGREDKVTGLSVYKQQVLESGPNSSSTHCRKGGRPDSGILWPGEEGVGPLVEVVYMAGPEPRSHVLGKSWVRSSQASGNRLKVGMGMELT